MAAISVELCVLPDAITPATATTRLPAPLRHAATVNLHAALVDATGPCGRRWNVFSTFSTVPISKAAPSTLAEVTKNGQRRIRISMPVSLAERLALNVSMGTDNPLNSVMRILSQYFGCNSIASAASTWLPPRRVSLLLLQNDVLPESSLQARHAASVREFRSLRLAELRGFVQDVFTVCWPTIPVAAHSQVADFARIIERLSASSAAATMAGPGFTYELAEPDAEELLADCADGGPRCAAGGMTPTVAPDPPLRIVLVAPPPSQKPSALRLLNARGVPLPDGSGFAWPPKGALLAWRDEISLDEQAAALVAQIRVLLGLEAATSEVLEGLAPTQHSLELPVHWLEVSALNHRCTLHLLDGAIEQLHLLPAFLSSAFERGEEARMVRELAENATEHIHDGLALLSRGHHTASCREAVRAFSYATAATHHPSLLPVEMLPPDNWLTTWPPLLFPILSAIVAALSSELGRWRSKKRKMVR